MASFKDALFSIFNSALKILGMANSQEHYIEVIQLEKCQDINGYYNTISREYLLCGTERMHNLIVEEVKLCKKPASPEHEYISAKVKPRRGATRRDPFYVVLERFRGEHMVPKDTEPTGGEPDSSTSTPSPTLPSPATQLDQSPAQSSPQRPSLFKSLSDSTAFVSDSAASVSEMASNGSFVVRDGSSSSSDKIRGSRVADDKVTLLVNHHNGRYSGDDVVNRKLTFSDDSPLYFYELVTLARAINHAEERYLLIGGQCYYYAGSIANVLQDLCSDVLAVKGDGKCMNIPIYAGNRLEIEKLISIYEEAKATLEKTVSDIEQTKFKKDKKIDDLTRAQVVDRKRIAELEHLLAR